MPCRCGSTTHKRINSKECPLRPKCKCGSSTHQRTNHNSCPLNKKNRVSEPVEPCSICLDDINPSEQIKTKCNHMYHKKCLARWLVDKSSCPICRTNLKRDTLTDEWIQMRREEAIQRVTQSIILQRVRSERRRILAAERRERMEWI